MRLIQDWKQAWKFYSVQALAVIAALPIVWASLPPEWQAEIPSSWVKWMVVIVAISGILGRIIDQKTPDAGGPA